MKKILTVSLFAMMAVSAANADIASTKFVTDRTGNTTFTGSVEGAADLTVAVNTLAGKVDTVAGSGEGSVSDQIDSALEDYTNTAGMNSAIDAAKQAAITAAANDATKYIDADELAASQGTQDTTLKAYADAAKEAAIAAIPAVDTTFSASSDNAATSKAIANYVNGIKNELSNGNTAAVNGLQEQIDSLDEDYVSETEIANYTNTTGMEAAIATAKSEAITAAANDAKKYIDESELAASQSAQDTTLKAYADTQATAAKDAAITAAKSAGDAAYAAKSYEAIVDADKAFREEIANGTTTTGTDGTYALTATVSNGTVSGYKWELIGR